jgi:hypothetical protein
MGNIPSRAFDTEGVTSLRALNAPFLITTDELLDEVVTSDLADDMVSGLDEIGLVGLALLPEGLRHSFGFTQDLLGPADYEGGIIRAAASATTAAVFEALGATVVDSEIDQGLQIGMESAYVYDPVGTSVGNVVLFPKVNVLVVNAEVFSRLSGSQKEILEQAASETLNWSVASRIGDAAAAEEWCAGGGRIVTADGQALAALRDAVEPVYQQLRADQLTAELIDQIEEIKTSLPVEEPVVPDGCTGEPVDGEATGAEETDDPSIINGSYRIEWDGAELVDAFVALGAPSAEAEELAKNAGVVSLTFHDGNYDQVWETGFYAGDHCPGTYAISGNRITMVDTSDSNDCAGEIGATVVDAVWQLTDQGLLLSDFILSEQPGVTWFTAVHLSKPLMRVD